MARTRSENYEDIQRGILQKAASLFSERGYMRSSIAELADACGLSRGALYHYFDSKEAILYAILDAHLHDMLEQVEAAIAGETEPRAQFRAGITKSVEVNASSPHEQRVLLNDLSFLAEDEQKTLQGVERQIVDLMADLLVRLDQHGKIVKRTKKIYAMMLFGVINYTYTWYDPNGPVGPAEFAEMAADLYLDGFAPQAQGAVPARKKLARA